MAHYILLDANLIINAFDPMATKENRKKAQNIFKNLIETGVAFAITPLIRYEILRHPSFTDHARYKRLEAILDNYKVFNINEEITDLATQLYRYDVYTATNANKNFEKRRFDSFHFATAKCNELEICSFDKHLGQMEKLYKNYLKAINQSK